MTRRKLWMCLATILLCQNSLAQERVDKPSTTQLPSETSAAQVKQCLQIAREIAELSDAAEQAQMAGDIAAYNETVDPYNSATARWNAGCTRPYIPADMIRAENELGYRLCQYTKSPCLSEEERGEILLEERRQREHIQNRRLPSSELVSGVAQAVVVKCDAAEPDELVGLEWIAYDTSTRAATIRYMAKTLKGRITLARPHTPFSDKLNMKFPSPLSTHDSSALMEVMVFPVSDTEHRFVGVVTIMVDGERHMDFGVNNVVIRCRDLAH